jgi:hypothetical protein
MDFEIPWRRIATGAAVLILHAVALFLLALAMRLPIPAPNQVREIVLNLMKPRGSHTIQQDLHIPTPQMITPVYEPDAITIPPAQLKKALEQASPPGDLGGVGRYLYNCSGMFYEQLPARERTGCLLNKWDEKPSSNSPLLGVARPSQFDAVIAKRHEPDAAGTQHTCDQTAINSNLGLPCYNFAGH